MPAPVKRTVFGRAASLMGCRKCVRAEMAPSTVLEVDGTVSGGGRVPVEKGMRINGLDIDTWLVGWSVDVDKDVEEMGSGVSEVYICAVWSHCTPYNCLRSRFWLPSDLGVDHSISSS
jgi:hypothetical protein